MDSYTPVSYDVREMIEAEIQKGARGKVFYWSDEQTVADAAGQVLSMKEIAGEGYFIFLDSGDRIRIDKIITLFGKPGAGFEAYDSFANQCLACTGGYPL